MSNINISEATIALIDSLKSTTGAYGLAGTGSEYKIVTEMFLYKFLMISSAMRQSATKFMASAYETPRNGMLNMTNSLRMKWKTFSAIFHTPCLA